MSEWLKEHAWKACVRLRVPWVRIPLSPQLIIHTRRGGRVWLNALVLKTSKGLYPSGVRIPPPPHTYYLNKALFLERVFALYDLYIDLLTLRYCTRIYVIREHLGNTLTPHAFRHIQRFMYIQKN